MRVGFDDLDPRILPDMGVKVAFQESSEEGVPAVEGVSVPVTAVRRDGSAEIVMVVQGDVLERRAVTVGETTGAEARIVGGLAAGERVVVEGPAGLTDGDRVKEVAQ